MIDHNNILGYKDFSAVKDVTLIEIENMSQRELIHLLKPKITKFGSKRSMFWTYNKIKTIVTLQ